MGDSAAFVPGKALDHIALCPSLSCHCGEGASRFVRCAKCRKIIARCYTHGDGIVREGAAHC